MHTFVKFYKHGYQLRDWSANSRSSLIVYVCIELCFQFKDTVNNVLWIVYWNSGDITMSRFQLKIEKKTSKKMF